MLVFLKWLAGFTAVIAISFTGVCIWGYSVFVQPGPLVSDTTVLIPKGAGTGSIIRILAERRLISSELVFRVGVVVWGGDRSLRAGEFVIPAKVSLEEIIEILRSGKTVVRRLTVAEGLTTAEVLRRLASTEGLTGLVTSDPREGHLLPETYHFSYGDSREQIVQRMRSAMSRTLDELWVTRKPGLPYRSPKEALVMASIVERETGLPAERSRVAGVFVNRLNRGMRLQSDPTVIYALAPVSGSLGRNLTRKDLAYDHPYNTYVRAGLPPGPIANPGRDSIKAVLNPAETDELYFVANGKGGHAFSNTLKEHNRNVAEWKKIRKARAKKRSYSFDGR